MDGSIGPRPRHSGWGNYEDTQYTELSPLLVPANIDTTLPNNMGITNLQELPSDYPNGFYVGGKIVNVRAGDSAIIAVSWTTERQAGSVVYNTNTWFDIGGAIPPLYSRAIALRGVGPEPIGFTQVVYELDTWLANGALIRFNTDVATKIWAPRVVVHRLHRGRGRYP